MKKQLNEIQKLQKIAGIKETSLKIDDDGPTQAGALSYVLRSMSDEVQKAGRELEKELKKAGVELETNGYLINAIKYLVMAARQSK